MVIQPFLVFLTSYALCVINGFRFVAFVFLASALFTGFIAILQFFEFSPAWRLYDILSEIQSLPEQFQLREDINRPKGVSLTPIIFSYHIVSAYLLSNLLYRKGKITPIWYGILFFAFMTMAAANGTRCYRPEATAVLES